MYGNLILFDKPHAAEAGRIAGRLWQVLVETPQFPCWCDGVVVAEIALEDGENGPYNAEVRHEDLVEGDIEVMWSWEIDEIPGPRETLVPHLLHYSFELNLCARASGDSEISLWVAGQRLARRGFAVALQRR